MSERVAWAQLMRLGMGQLGLTPDVFWALTPAELFILAGADGGTVAMTRAGLASLEARFPDNARGQADDG